MRNAKCLQSLIGDHYPHLFDVDGHGRLAFMPVNGFYDHLKEAGRYLFVVMCLADERNAMSLTAAFGAHVRALSRMLYSECTSATAYNVCALLLMGYPADVLLDLLAGMRDA